MAKAPEERYATAAEMAADLRRFLDEQPILARRPSLVERARKWMRRHPSLVGAAVLLLVFVAGGLGGDDRAGGPRASANRQPTTERQGPRGRGAVPARPARRGRHDPGGRRGAGRQAAPGSVRKRLLEAALAYYQKFIEYRREDPDAQAELAVTRDRVKKIVDDLAVLQGMGQLFLLENEAVREDLLASAEQDDRLAELSERLAKQRQRLFGAFHRLTPEQRRQRFVQAAREQRRGHPEHPDPAAVAPAAANRDPGPRAGRLPGAGDRRRAEADGRAARTHPRGGSPPVLRQAEPSRGRFEEGAFRHAEGEDRRPAAAGRGTAQPRRRDRGRRRTRRRWRPARRRALAVLTREQTAKWQELIGKPFAGAATLRLSGPSCPPGLR